VTANPAVDITVPDNRARCATSPASAVESAKLADGVYYLTAARTTVWLWR